MCLKRLPLIRPSWRRGRRSARGVESLHGLADSPVAVVVGVQNADRAVREGCGSHRHKTVLGIVGVGEGAVIGHVAVGVVGKGGLRRVEDAPPYRGILVQTVGDVGVRGKIRRRPEAVADGVVGVAVEVRTYLRGSEFRTSVVQPSSMSPISHRFPFAWLGVHLLLDVVVMRIELVVLRRQKRYCSCQFTPICNIVYITDCPKKITYALPSMFTIKMVLNSS